MSTNEISIVPTLTLANNPAAVIALAILPWVLIVVLCLLAMWLLPKIQSSMSQVNPRTIDGTLLTLLAGFIFSQAYFSGKEAYEYVNPTILWWLKYGFGVAAAVFLALKNFRYGITPQEPQKNLLTDKDAVNTTQTDSQQTTTTETTK